MNQRHVSRSAEKGAGRFAVLLLLAFTAALVELTESPELRAQFGMAARRYAEEHLARDRVLGDFERALKRCLGKPGQSAQDSIAAKPASAPDERGQTPNPMSAP